MANGGEPCVIGSVEHSEMRLFRRMRVALNSLIGGQADDRPPIFVVLEASSEAISAG